MGSVLIVVHPSEPEATRCAEEITTWWERQNTPTSSPIPVSRHTVSLPPTSFTVYSHDITANLNDLNIDPACLDVAVSLGGDGTMLRAVSLVGSAGIPVLGVNYGQLGYLAEVEPGHVIDALAQIQSDNFTSQERMRINVELLRQDGTSQNLGDVLNEVVAEKRLSGRTICLGVSVGGTYFTRYVADGLIVSTPTGSTAYSLSAGGPVVEPFHDAILLTPVAPHMLFNRTLILSPDAEIRLEVLSDRAVEVAADGQHRLTLEPGDSLLCRRSEHPAKIISFAKHPFLHILKEKFEMKDR